MLRKIVCIGQTCIDITTDMYSAVGAFDPNGARIGASAIRFSLGGDATNVAIALRKLGAPAQLISRVSDDIIGDCMPTPLQHYDVDVSQVLRGAQTKTATQIFRFRDRERTLFIDTRDYVPYKVPLNAVSKGDIVAPCSFCKSLCDPPVQTQQITSEAKKRGGIICAATYTALNHPDFYEYRSALKNVDYFFPNIEEALQYTNTKPPEDACHVLQSWGVQKSLLLQKAKNGLSDTPPEWFSSYGHHTVSWPMLLQRGFGGIRTSMQDRLVQDELSIEQLAFYQNGIIVCNAYECYATRYATLARELAQTAVSETRRSELLQMAENLDHVPMQPARTFHEALQAIWLVQLVHSNVCGARDYAFGRMDQHLLPYYEADITAGRLNHGSVLELIESFFVKINEIIGYCVYNHHPKRSLCNHSLQYIYISGTDDAGNDATNALSYLFLEACSEIQMQQPTLYIHYHDHIDRVFLRKAIAVTREGRGDPCYYNDAKVIEALINTDVITSEDARHFTHYGCNQH